MSSYKAWLPRKTRLFKTFIFYLQSVHLPIALEKRADMSLPDVNVFLQVQQSKMNFRLLEECIKISDVIKVSQNPLI